MANNKVYCRMEHCETEATYKTLELCQACYSGLRRLAHRSAAYKRQRYAQIQRLEARMETVMVHGPGSNELMPGHTKKRGGKRRAKK